MTLLLTNDDLAQIIRPAEFIAAQDEAYRAFAAGNGVCAPRIDVQSGAIEGGGNYQLGLAVGMSGRYAALRIKSDIVLQRLVDGVARKEKYCGQPGTYMGLVLVFDATSGVLLAILHDGLLQKMRVGADSALGVRYMARKDASVLGVLGSGGMARAHVAAIREVRPLRRVQVFSPNRTNREAFCREIEQLHGIEATAVEKADAIYRGADLVASCASAIGPMIHGSQLEPGMHVTCIGGTLDPDANRKIDIGLRFGLAPSPAELSGIAFDYECMTFAQGGAKAGHAGTSRYADLSPSQRLEFRSLIEDPARGRGSDRQITFSERGNIHGLQFAAVGGLLYERALVAGLGRRFEDTDFLQTIRN